MTISEIWQTSLKFGDPFFRHLFRYLSIREGVALEVYKDIYKLDTVGVGHRIYPADGKPFGTEVSVDFVIKNFQNDLISHRATDFKASVPFFNLAGAIAMASFAWVHGPGQFWNSATHNLLKNPKTTEAQLQSWVKANWDRAKPVNQARNEADFELIFPRKLDGVVYHMSHLSSGTFVYVPAINESFTSLSSAIAAAKKKVVADRCREVFLTSAGKVTLGISHLSP